MNEKNTTTKIKIKKIRKENIKGFPETVTKIDWNLHIHLYTYKYIRKRYIEGCGIGKYGVNV